MPAGQKSTLDPEQQEYEKNFDFERHERKLMGTRANAPDNPAERANMDRANAWSRDTRPIAERESAPWNTNVKSIDSKRAQETSSPNNRFSAKNILKRRATQWAIGGLITLIFGITAAIPTALSGALVNLKELTSDWANKNNHSYFSKNSSKYFKEKLFQADENCKSGVKCRFKTGVSDKEIDKMKAAGLNPEVGKSGDRKYIISFSTTDVEGNKVKINADNFEDHYSQNIAFRGLLDQVAKPKSMFLRGKVTIEKVFHKFGANRNRVIDGKDDKERTKNFRADIYGEGNDIEKVNSVSDGTEEDNKKISGVDDSINEAAQQERKRLESTGYDRAPSIVPDVSSLDLSPDLGLEIGNKALKEGARSSFKGALETVNIACSGYQLIRTFIFGAKVYKAIGLIKYAALFMTISDKLKAGDSPAPEIAFIAGILFKPSIKKDSYGKTFFNSEGFNLISQGKIADHRGLARFTNATPYMRSLQQGKKYLESLGANKETCKHVQKWYGQLGLFIAGLALDAGTGGWAIVASIATGALIGMVMATIEAYAIPLIIQYIAGTVAPDPTDPEGGYGAGNAIAAGMGAFGNFAGRANGERILSTADAAAVEMESNQEVAFMNKVENYGKNPFSLDNPNTVTSQLAFAVAPIAASPFSQSTMQTVGSIVTSPFSLLASSLGGIVTNGASAQSDTQRGGQFCADEEYQQMNLAPDAFCNPIPGEKDSTIKDPKYRPGAVDDWMFKNDHADPESGEPKSDDFKKYIASCVDGVAPISPDGGGADVGENIDTRWCMSTEEKFTYFRFFLTNNAIDSAHEASVNGTLGLDESAPQNVGLTGKTFPNGKIPEQNLCELGSSWPGHRLRCDAANKFGALAAAFEADMGKKIVITDSYRTYEQQVECYNRPNTNCTTPGTSNHGCGQAVDFAGGINTGKGAEYNWMVANAGKFGWLQPDWAKPGGSNTEEWHWEYGTGGNSNSGTCQL